MMNWRDFLYFSKGERQALILLLVLIAAGSIFLVINDKKREAVVVAATQPRYIVHPENAPVPRPIDRAEKPAKPQPVRSNRLPRRKLPGRESVRRDKLPAGSLVELNTADTTTLKKVPGIGSVFAGRIVKYRALLGGFYSVAQLREVYGIDEERYLSLQNWFYADTSFLAKLAVNHLSPDALARHPYLSYKQAYALHQLCRRKRRLDGWENLRLLEEFTEADHKRLSAYLSFQ
ncbi:MAG: helix-hairpin-helix domain-containing protein [Tannerellaceae bacterium]|jgi:hypothetical protein|nr:helix-hairpin-helix domain-containing protein [Tannerellaceae bacterium]